MNTKLQPLPSPRYAELIALVLPLCLVNVAVDIGEHSGTVALTRASDSSNDRTTAVAAFTSAFFFAKLLSAAGLQLRSIVVVLANDVPAFWLVTRVALVTAALQFTLMVIVALSPLCVMLSGIDDAPLVSSYFIAFCALPAFDGAMYHMEGLLLRRRRTSAVAIASLCDIGAKLAAAAIAVAAPQFIQRRDGSVVPIFSVLPLYVGQLANLSALLWFVLWTTLREGFLEGVLRRLTHVERLRDEELQPLAPAPTPAPVLAAKSAATSAVFVVAGPDAVEASATTPPRQQETFVEDKGGDSVASGGDEDHDAHRHDEESESLENMESDVKVGQLPKPGEHQQLTVRGVAAFALPLLVTTVVQRASRPLINAVVAYRFSTSSVAAIGLVYALGHLNYGWVNRLDGLAPSFLPRRGASVEEQRDLALVRQRDTPRLIACAMLVSLTLGITLTASGAYAYVLIHLNRTPHTLLAATKIPFAIFTIFAFPVALRAALVGRATARKETHLMRFNGPARLLAVLLASLLLPAELGGAGVGVGALFAGFCAEALTLAAMTACATKGVEVEAKRPVRKGLELKGRRRRKWAAARLDCEV